MAMAVNPRIKDAGDRRRGRGTVRELIRHPSIERIDMVEIDEKWWRQVVGIFPRPQADDQVRLLFMDGVKFVADKESNTT